MRGINPPHFNTLKQLIMPNWCSNIVEFKGEHHQREDLKSLFEAMAKKEQRERKGQLPPFVKKDTGYFFETRWDDGILYFDTRWSPNIEIIEQIADHYALDFIHDYFEPGNGVYGQAVYENGTLTDIFLDDNDYSLYQYDEQSEKYVFEGEPHESDTEILETLLERKIAINNLQL